MPTKEQIANGQLLALINQLERKVSPLADSDFPRQTEQLRARWKQGEPLDNLLPFAYALAREVAKRKLKQRPFDVQTLGALALHQGKVAEIKTGEGKTLVATLPAYLNALTGGGVHIVTVNEYLAKRDAEWMGPVYATLGLSVGSIVPDKSYLYVGLPGQGGPLASPFPIAVAGALKECTRKEAYQADITYGLVSEFGFDYLRDNMEMVPSGQVQRSEEEGGHYFALLDEVDSILIDEARTPLIIAQATQEDTALFRKFAEAVKALQEEQDFEVDPELNVTYLTEEGERKLEKIVGVENLYDPANETLAFHAEAAVKARALFARDKEYVVKDGEVVIVDEFTGRLMSGRRFTEGLHQAIEAKEGVPIKSENKTLASISIQSYFKKYKKLAGMSGTAHPGKREFEEVYGMTVEEIPTNKPVIRKDHADRIYRTRAVKERAIIEEVTRRRANLQPVLLGTRSIEANEHLSNSLGRVPHKLLNAKNHEQEATIIAQAGHSGSVTVATNLAGRGVDILLGGNPPDLTDSVMVKAAGGLVVIGTERHESKRIDDQLRGRSGRQGDPGESIFYLSLDDELVRLFASEELETLQKKHGERRSNIPLTKPEVAALFETAQQRVEGRNEEIRKELLKYDSFIDHQREAIYHMRNTFLLSQDLTATVHADLFAWLQGISTMVRRYQVTEQETMIDFAKAIRVVRPLFVGVSDEMWLSEFQKVETVREFGSVIQRLVVALEEKVEKMGAESLITKQRKAYLAAIDELWMEHLTELETIRAGIDFTAYAGREPLDEFKREADEKFRAMLARIPEEAVEKYLRSLV